MKRTILGLLAFFLLFSTTFLLAEEKEKTWWYTHPVFKISLRLPKSWILTSQILTAGNIATFSKGAKKEHSYFVIVANKLLNPLPLEEYVRINLATTLATLPNCRLISTRSLNLAGISAREVVLEWTTESGGKIVILKPVQYYLINEGIAYILIAKLPKRDFEKDLPEIKEVLKTLKFLH